MEHGPSDAGERGEGRRKPKSKAKESFKKFHADKTAKLEVEATQLTSNIFAGVQVYVEGYTPLVSAYALKKMIVLNGGKISRVFSKRKTTHMVCTTLSASKIDKFMNRHKPSQIIHFVHPNWILHSCKAGHLLPEGSFSILIKSCNC
eukprot:Phypoly_transcript_20071.p1 GENE.Phypoly_transcript_20071~~Phypoly_transcript_20071.p1  ORF type:complete len:147 (+),score=14.36 Phypoly_transcript_20071:31-471(+)